MSFRPFVVTVTRSERISPSFQRVTFTGVDDMGPAGPVHDLRIKLLIPPADGVLPDLSGEDGYQRWQQLPEHERGVLRTYSVRHLHRHPTGSEIDVDFVMHDGDDCGPACQWARDCSPGDQLIILGPGRDDDSRRGIEFHPREATSVQLFGDETAMPAILRILDEWPEGLTGSAHIEVPSLADRQHVNVPKGVRLCWYQRAADHGCALMSALCEHLDVADESPSQDVASELVWETPSFSAAGEAITDSPCTDCYYWIAGKSSMVTAMRRVLVQEAGVPRANVSFMGYWK